MEMTLSIISIFIAATALFISWRVVYNRLKSALYGLFVCYAIHYERIRYILNMGKKNFITWGSMEIESVNSLISSYLSMTDRKERRRELIIELHDFSFQIAFHLNIPVKERLETIPNGTKEGKPAYAFAFGLAASKHKEYREKMEELAVLMPPIDICDRLRRWEGKQTYAQKFLQSRIHE